MPRRRSLILTDHELRLMNVLWDRKQATVGEVADALDAPPLAYTTVLSTMRTLEEKGYVAHRKSGRAFVYRPLVQRDDAATSLLDTLLDRFFANSPGVLAMTLLEDKRLSKKDLARLKQVIEQKGRAK